MDGTMQLQSNRCGMRPGDEPVQMRHSRFWRTRCWITSEADECTLQSHLRSREPQGLLVGMQLVNSAVLFLIQPSDTGSPAADIAGTNCREKRINNRRQRIQDHLRGLREGEAAGPEKQGDAERVGPGKQQTLESARRIMGLRNETDDKVSAVRLGSDHAENLRRIAEEQSKQALRSRLLAEAEASARKNAAVAMKWADLFTIEVPQARPLNARPPACWTSGMIGRPGIVPLYMQQVRAC